MGGGDLVSITDKFTGCILTLSLSLSLCVAIELEEELASVHFSKLGEGLESRAAS